MPKLGVNIDHVATLRQARYREAGPEHPLAEPSPLAAARAALEGGAHSITAHLREDRRHIQDHDIYELKNRLAAPLNLEMAVTESMTDLALQLHPQDVCLVPENRREVTTEGGLDARKRSGQIRQTVEKISAAGIVASLFIDPDPEQIRAAADSGAPCIELHTGAYANALEPAQKREQLDHLRLAAELAHKLGLQVNAGHGLNYFNLRDFLLAVPHLDTLNIGHAIVSRAISTGMKQAVADMVEILKRTAA